MGKSLQQLYQERMSGPKTLVYGKHKSTGRSTFRNFLNALNDYQKWVSQQLKRGVQVETGALRDSILGLVGGNQTDYFDLGMELNDYWKYLRDPIPWDKIYSTAFLQIPDYYSKYNKDTWISRYNLDLDYWSEVFHDALEEDLSEYFGTYLSDVIRGTSTGRVQS